MTYSPMARRTRRAAGVAVVAVMAAMAVATAADTVCCPVALLLCCPVALLHASIRGPYQGTAASPPAASAPAALRAARAPPCHSRQA